MQEIMALLEQVEFIFLAAAVVILAYLALEHKEIVYATFIFGIMAAVVSGFFLLLDAPFVAGVQIAVYTGGISALVIFAVLLLPRAQDSSLEVFESPRMKHFGMVLSGAVILLSGFLALVFPWFETIPADRPGLVQSIQNLAAWLWGTHAVYVELVALIMVTTIVGAVTIMKMEKEARLQEGFDQPSTGGPSPPETDKKEAGE